MKPSEFLSQYGRDLESLEYCYGVDNNQNRASEFEQARLKLLFVFMSPGSTRSVGNTYTVLNGIVKEEFGEDVFVDTCYLPCKDDIKVYEKANTEFLFGNVSHKSWREYDIIAFSLAILPEIYNYPYVLRVNNIPPTWEKREEQDIPLILLGGVCSPMADILYGDGCLVDMVYVGHAESRFNECIRIYLKNLEAKKPLSKRDVIVKIAKKIDCVYLPWAYDYDYELSSEYGYVIKSIESKYGLSKKVKFDHLNSDTHAFVKKIMNVSGEAVTGGDVDISVGCAGSGCCSFCFEGTVAGKWRDHSFDLVKAKIKTLRQYSAPNSVSWYSYNGPYYYRFVDLIREAAATFSSMSLLNMRADVIGARPDYLEIAKLLGLRRASMAVEGMGESIRNGFFNKSLTFKQWKDALRVVFSNKLAECKMGYIYCGKETRKDYDESLNEFREMIEMREEMGANTSMRITITPLVYYPFTALQGFRKDAAINSLLQVRELSYYLKELSKLGIRSKINARGRSTFMEQFLLDFGRIGTKYLKFLASEEPPFYGSIPKRTEELLLEMFKMEGLDPLPFLYEKPLDYVYWHSNVICIDEKYLKRAEKRVRERRPMRPCLRTPANLKPKCNECGACKTKEEKLATTRRDFESKSDINDVMLALKRAKPRCMSLVTFNIKEGFYWMSAAMASHRITAEFLRHNDSMERSFSKVDKSNLSWVTSNLQRDWYTGRIHFSILWRESPDLETMNTIIEEARFESFVVERVSEPTLYYNFWNFADINIFLVKAPKIGIERFQKNHILFDGTILVASKALGPVITLEEKYFKDLFVPKAVEKGGILHVLLALPLQVNPYLYMSSVTGIKYKSMLKEVDVKCLATLRKSTISCGKCGKLVYEDISQIWKVPVCPECLLSILASKMAS